MLHHSQFMGSLNFFLTDNLYGGRSPLNSIIIVGIDDRSIQELGRWPWDRAVFANLTEKLSTGKVIGFDIGFYEETSSDDVLAQSFIGKTIVLASQVNSFTRHGTANQNLLPPEILRSSAASTGYVNVYTHPDGITRAVNLNLSLHESHFAYEVFQKAHDQPRETPSLYYINYPAPPYTFHLISVVDVLSGKVESSAFNNKIVLIGATSQSLKDHYFVPTSSGVAMPGVEVHASIIQTLLLQNELRHQSPLSIYLLIALCILIVGTVVYFLRPIQIMGILLGTIIIYEFLAIIIFDANVILNLIYPPLTIILSFPLFYAASYTIERRERKKIETAFGKYLSPNVVSHLLDNKETVELGGEEREMTIFFSDIRGFTTLSEKLTPAKLVSTLNEYFSIMSSIIVKNNGIVDKYIGDAIMAFWGAPADNKNHSLDAAKSSLEMKRALRKIKQDFHKKGIEIDIGIGINTGPVIVGNIGSKERFDYTVIGDAVNLASRVEGLTKNYGTTIIITEYTKKHLSAEFITRELDLVAVKGKTKPVALFELIDVTENVEPDTHEFIRIYEGGLVLYRQGEFMKAKEKFQESFQMKHDQASKLMMERCDEYEKNVPADWKGVYIAKSK